jgi:hypothetical protein
MRVGVEIVNAMATRGQGCKEFFTDFPGLII